MEIAQTVRGPVVTPPEELSLFPVLLSPSVFVLHRSNEVGHGHVERCWNTPCTAVLHDLSSKEVNLRWRFVGDILTHRILVNAHLLQVTQGLRKVVLS